MDSTPLTQLLIRATKAGVGFRLYGRAVQVIGAANLTPDLAAALRACTGAIWEHLGGAVLDAPPLALLFKLGVDIVVPKNVDEAQSALVEIEADSDVHTPKELAGRPGLVSFDIETAAKLGMEQRPPVKLKKNGEPAKRQPPLNSDAGLDPLRSHPRLLQFYGGGRRCVVLDTNQVPLDIVAPVLQRRTAIIHNASFDIRHLAAAGVEIPYFEDSMQAAGLLLGVQRRGLDDAVAAYLDLELPKGLQRSDWSSPHLSAGQLAYAAIDAIVTFRLWLKLRLDLVSKGRGEAYLLQRSVTPTVSRMIDRGVLIDRAIHAAQVASWSETHAKATEAFITDTGRDRPPHTDNEKRSYLQEVLPPVHLETWPRTRKGLLSIRAAQLRRFAYMPPIRSLLAISAAEKLLNVFGSELVNKISPISGRLHPSYNIAATKAGRASSNRPNVQQIPKHRAPEFRKCIVAAPGMVLVVGDFNMMELRAAAAMSDDAQMKEDFASGVDLHRQQAAAMLGIPYDKVTKEARDHAKPVNFSMIYGAGASGIVASAWNNYGVVLTLEAAEAAKQAFLCRYATYANWMRANYALSTNNGFITCGRYGRVIEATWETPSATNGNGEHNPLSWSDEDEDDCEEYVEYYGHNSGWASDLLKYALCCNAPIQGACADASMLALLKVDAALRKAKITGGPVLFVHDEIALEVSTDQAEEARRVLETGMTEAFAEVFPTAPLNGVVSTGVGDSWGGAKP